MTRATHAPSAGSTEGSGNSRGLLRRALVTRDARQGSKGSGAPGARLLGLLAIALIALFASVGTASADTAEISTVSNVSYASAHVTGKASSAFGSYNVQYSKDPDGEGWTASGVGGFIFGNQLTEFEGDIGGLKGETTYFVRLVINGGATVSPGPNPEFTTLPVAPPTLPGSVGTSTIYSTSAGATGSVERPANADPAFDVTCRFEYVSEADFTATGFAGAASRPCAENPIGPGDASTQKAVSAQLGCPNPVVEDPEGKCLKPETTYHLRLIAENAAPGVVTKDAATTFTTTPKVAKPTVISIGNAVDVGVPRGSYATVQASGEVQRPAGTDPALDVNCRFEYISDTQLKDNESNAQPPFAGAAATSCDVSLVQAEDPTAVNARIELTAGTTYHLRLVAENGGGLDTKEASTFTTPPARLPIATIDPAVAGYTTAEVSGTIKTEGCGLTSYMYYTFQYTTEPANPDSWSSSGVGGEISDNRCESVNPVPVGGTITGLQPGTEYSVRLHVDTFYDPASVSPEPHPTLATKPVAAPSATLDPVSSITATTAHFSGTVNANAPGPLDALGEAAYETKWHIECTPECKDKNGNTIGGVVQGDDGAQTVSGDAKRLDPNTNYEVSLVVSSEGGDDTDTVTFSTPLVKPTVIAAPGGSDGRGGYVLQGTVNPNKSLVTSCIFAYGPNAGLEPDDYAFLADCSPAPGDGVQRVTVEAPLTGLTPGATYQFRIFATNAAGQEKSENLEFVPTLAEPEECENAQRREENSSLALPECRAYEMVTPANKEGSRATFLKAYGESGDVVNYQSEAGNIARSGQNGILGFNFYVTERSATGWETIPDLNGSSGSLRGAPSFARGVTGITYSSDFQSSIYVTHRKGDPGNYNYYLRSPDGTFALIGNADNPVGLRNTLAGASTDLSHLLVGPFTDGGETFLGERFSDSPNSGPTLWGPGVYELIGTGVDTPRRADVDNFGSPISSCQYFGSGSMVALGRMISADGRTSVFTVKVGCGGADPETQKVWARVNGTTSFDVSASHCTRTVADPGGACNASANVKFRAGALDGSRLFFNTTQQLVNGDTDQTNDLYACDIPAGTPAPVGQANSCSPLHQVSAGDATGADVQSFVDASEDGSTVYFTAKGVLAANEGAFKEEAVAGDENLYVWRTDAAHPAGVTAFIARFEPNDVSGAYDISGAQTAAADGRYLVFTTGNRFVDSDTDTARDVYRYDAGTGELTRVSTNVFGVGGNGDGFDAEIQALTGSHPTVSDDGQKIIFATSEALSAADANGEPDIYLWTPARVSLISTGASGGGVSLPIGAGLRASISASGRDIFFQTAAALTPADGDDVEDVYDARIGGGFSFVPAAVCSGEACQPPPSSPPASKPLGSQSAGSGNPIPPKPCPKGKVRKRGKCVKKTHKKHSEKKHHGKKASHKRGGGK